MNIRKKLTLRFVGIVASILVLTVFFIYYSSLQYRQNSFINRLNHRAESSAKLLVGTDGVDSVLLKIIDETHPAAFYKVNIAIYNQLNKIVYSNKNNLDIKVDYDLLAQIKIEKKVYFKQNEFEVVGILYNHPTGNYVVLTGAIDNDGLNNIRNLRDILFIVLISGILIVFIVGWIYTGRALLPISRMIRQVDNITLKDTSSRLEIGENKDEIDNLAITFNNMLNRIEKSIISQKKFISNASHEIRTPLTAIKGQLEVAMLNDRSSEYYKNKINSVLDDIENLIHESNQLLVLAKVESENQMMNFKPLRIDELAWLSRGEVIKNNPSYSVDVKFDNMPDDDNKLEIFGNEQLLKIAFINLLDNACKFSNGKVLLYIKFNADTVALKFEDKGLGIEDLELANIYEPFYRCNNTHHIKGNGLGLSLVKKIVLIHKGTIKVESIVKIGTIFTIDLPLI